MKDNIFKNKTFTSLWIAVHGFIFITLAVLFFCGTKFKINTNLFDILPKTNASREVSKADNLINSKTGRMFIVLVKDRNFELAKKSASNLYNLLNLPENKKTFEKIDFFVDKNVMTEITDFYYKNRFNLLDSKTVENLKTDSGIIDFIEESLLNIYSGLTPKENIEEDPFALGEYGLSNALGKILDTGTSMSVHDGVLCAFDDDACYVMLRGILTADGASITNKSSGVKKIYEYAESVKSGLQNLESEKNSEIEFIYSGVPFHSYESSSKAQSEITVISTVSMILVILLCFFVFRNLLPVGFSVGAILISVLFALSSVLVVFKEIHILTFVFGTTLIGTCLDYSVHFFVRWKGEAALKSGIEIRKKLLKGLTLSLVSTEICYLLLFFAPFALLKQVAIFSFTGILSSYLTVICLFPLLKVPEKNRQIKFLQNRQSGLIKENVRRTVFAFFVVAIGVTAVIFYKNVKVENDLKSFYSMKGNLLESEITANRILNSGSSGWYFIVKGQTKDELLENEFNFCKKLDDYISDCKDREMTYNSVTKFVPPKSEQKKSYNAVRNLLQYAEDQFLLLGYDSKEAKILAQNFKTEYDEKNGSFLDFETDTPEFIKSAVASLWVGEVDSEWFSIVMPMHFKDSEFCKNLTLEDDNVFFMNKMSDVSNELNVLTRLILVFLVMAFVVMAAVLKIFYKWKEVLKIILIPLITVFTCITLLTAFKIPLGFFSVTGIILVFGLSIDYIIYAVENSERLNTLAIFLSFVSSALSFGALALSSFAPVFMFGFTVSVGLTTAFLCTMLVKK